MHLEAVTCCVGYDDFLAETAAFNRQHFDRYVVVTSHDDEATADVCHRLNLECVRTGDFTRHGDAFNKGRAVEHGLAMLSHADWVCHLDADIALPTDFRESLRDADLDPDCLYGDGPAPAHGVGPVAGVEGPGLDAGLSLLPADAHPPHRGPMGRRPLWLLPDRLFPALAPELGRPQGHPPATLPRLPLGRGAGRREVALQWDRRRRQLLPEVIVAHLESEPCPTGHNWRGRRTRRFGPGHECPPIKPAS